LISHLLRQKLLSIGELKTLNLDELNLLIECSNLNDMQKYDEIQELSDN